MEPDFSHTLLDGAMGLSTLLDTLEDELAGRDVPMAVIGAVLIAADEVITNALSYGGAPSVEVAGQVADERVVLRVSDDGAAFDPLAATTPDTTLGVEDREIGGLGIHLVRKMMDDVAYERRGKYNRLQFSKSFASSSTSRQPAGEAT